MGLFNLFSSDKTSTNQSTTNNVTNQQTGASEHGVALGAASHDNTVNNITVSNDLDVIHESLGAALNLGGTALASNTEVSGKAIDVAGAGLALSKDYLEQGGKIAGAGLALANNVAADSLNTARDIAGISSATSLDMLHASLNGITSATHDASGVAVASIGAVERTAGVAIAGNLDALHASLNAVNTSQAISDTLLQSSIGQFTGALETTANNALQVAANAAPQTDAALLERLASRPPIDGASAAHNGMSFDWQTIGTVALIIAVAYYFIKTAK